VASQKQNFNINQNAIVSVITDAQLQERVLLIGWNHRAYTIITEMDNYVAQGSYMKVVVTFNDDLDKIAQLATTLKNIRLDFQHADTTSRVVLDKLDVTNYTSILLLCYKDNLEMQDADAQTLITLLHLRRISEETGKEIKVVSEMLDLRNRDLAEVTKADDFIVSDKLISLLISQVSENKYLMPVFADLFSADGSEIYLKPVSDYVSTGESINFYTVLESARNKGETAIGYRIAEHLHDSEKAYGVKVNPAKSVSITFSENDKIIVLAES
jgi:voltage-gated potassium channel Kch